MPELRYFTDEDIYGATVVALRGAGINAVSTPESGRLAEPDESQLQWATEAGRVLVTFNVADFARLHARWLRVSRSHSGIVVASQRPIGDLVRRLTNLSHARDASAMINRIEFLSDW